jgi:MerR family transcriptional regulator, thiopeptide resistance regulator
MKERKLTVSALARSAGLSRSTLLYYDRLGLLRPHHRSVARYRIYSAQDVQRLEQICLYKQMGVRLTEIRRLLVNPEGNAAAAILQRRLRDLGRQIDLLRRQQRQIAGILKQKALQTKELEMINKERWVEIMRAAGLSQEDMQNWHTQFEKMEPDAHQEFLESLGIEPTEIARIRKWSRGEVGRQ